MKILDRFADMVAVRLLHALRLDPYDRRAQDERMRRLEKMVKDIYDRPSANARTYEVRYADDSYDGIVRSEPMPRATNHRSASFAVGHDNLRHPQNGKVE